MDLARSWNWPYHHRIVLEKGFIMIGFLTACIALLAFAAYVAKQANKAK